MIRKEYENGNPNNIRMKDIRDWVTKDDGIASTVTTVELDRMIMECYILDDLYANRSQDYIQNVLRYEVKDRD